MHKAIALPRTRTWLQRCFEAALRFGSVCSGAYILAELGKLDGLRVATHWADCVDLGMRYPSLSVDKNALFIVSGKAWTSAGISTGIDMALAMVEQDTSRQVADKVAKFANDRVFEAVKDLQPGLPTRDYPGFGQHLQVFRNIRLSAARLGHQLADIAFAIHQGVQNCQSRGVAQHAKASCHSLQ